MKNTAMIFAFAMMLLSCGTTSYLDKETFMELTTKDEFTFTAKRANPMDYTAVNMASNGIVGAIPTRILELDYGYHLTLKKDSLKVNLPYFGRAYRASYGGQNLGFSFETTDFKMLKKQGKKGSVLYEISVGDQSAKQMFLEIFPTGKAYLSIEANDRQPISYDGSVGLIKN